MPVPALLAAALPVLGQAIGQKTGYKKQRRLMEYQNTMNVQNYQMQKQDNIDFWNMQNEYNSPEAQMARLKEAGLNPNMVYGNGGGLTDASPIRGGDIQGVSVPSQQTTDYGIGESLANYQMAEIRQANVDNLKQDLINKRTINDLNVIKALGQAITNETGEFDLGQKRRMADINFELLGLKAEDLKAQIENRQMDTFVTYEGNQRAEGLQKGKIKLQIAQAGLTIAQTANTQAEYNRIIQATEWLKKSNILADAEIEARKNGWSWKDPALHRFILKSVPTEKLAKTLNEKLGDILDFIF